MLATWTRRWGYLLGAKNYVSLGSGTGPLRHNDIGHSYLLTDSDLE